MKSSRPRARAATTRASCNSNISRDELFTTSRAETEANVRSPPNSAPVAAAISSRLDEAKNEAEFRAWPRSWPSINRLSRPIIWNIQLLRMTVMSVLSTPPRRLPNALSRGS